MPFVQALKRLINTSESSNTGSASSGETHSTSIDQSVTASYTPNSANGSQRTSSTLNSKENFKPLSQGLQKKYAKGVQYNMKLVIRGECNTGKSALWARLQGNPFMEDYVPSDEIRVATINWASKVCEDAIVKVEVWDVVDKSRKKRRPLNPSLKLANDIDLSVTEVSLDAEFLDVYKSTSGVLFIYDITKPWTWDYIEREIVRVPAHIPILIIGNQLDLNHHRKVSTEKCLSFIEQFDRGNMGSVIRYCESSMRNAFGLKYIYQFLNIPFLQLQRESLLQQLQINSRDMDSSLEEIDTFARSDENNYDLFIENLANKRRTKQEALAGEVVAKAKPLEEAKRLHDEALQAAALAEQKQASTAAPLQAIVQTIKKTTEPAPAVIKPTPTSKQKPPVVTVHPIVQQVVPKSTAQQLVRDDSTAKVSSTDDAPDQPISNPLVASTVDDFVPDDNDYETFLVDDNYSLPQTTQTNYMVQSSVAKFSTGTTDDENEIVSNPMVKGFREQLDSDDEHHTAPIVNHVPSADYEPESPLVEPMSNSLPVPVFHQISSSDLDFLDQLTSSKSKSSYHEPSTLDTESLSSGSVVMKPKKKKNESKGKKEVTNSTTTDTSKVKKKKKSSTTKQKDLKNEPINPANDNDEDDLESFLADVPVSSNRNGNDYEDV